MKRRDFITVLGGAAAWPVVARAQQARGRSVVGLVSVGAVDSGVFRPFLEQMGQLGRSAIAFAGMTAFP
jgi:putative ABC transport system substrate-binding protein